MTHPRMQAFFKGALQELLGAYKKSEEAPNACKGSLREVGIRRAIRHSLPGLVHLYSGEIIDPRNGQSGQLDGILVRTTGVALATGPDEDRVVPIEGVAAVLESKSNMKSQWKEVIRTWEKLRKLRRDRHLVDRTSDGATLAGPPVTRDSLPFIVFARAGWATGEKLAQKALELAQLSPAVLSPANVILVQFDPPGAAIANWAHGSLAKKVEVGETAEAWKTLAFTWIVLTRIGGELVGGQPDWEGYLGMTAPPR
jgi:hypothetical protein